MSANALDAGREHEPAITPAELRDHGINFSPWEIEFLAAAGRLPTRKPHHIDLHDLPPVAEAYHANRESISADTAFIAAHDKSRRRGLNVAQEDLDQFDVPLNKEEFRALNGSYIHEVYSLADMAARYHDDPELLARHKAHAQKRIPIIAKRREKRERRAVKAREKRSVPLGLTLDAFIWSPHSRWHEEWEGTLGELIERWADVPNEPYLDAFEALDGDSDQTMFSQLIDNPGLITENDLQYLTDDLNVFFSP